MVGFAIHQHESAMGVHVSSCPETSSDLPPHPISLGCPSAPALSALFHARNFTYRNKHVSMLFSQIIPPLPSPTESKSLFFISVSLLLSCI